MIFSHLAYNNADDGGRDENGNGLHYNNTYISAQNGVHDDSLVDEIIADNFLCRTQSSHMEHNHEDGDSNSSGSSCY